MHQGFAPTAWWHQPEEHRAQTFAWVTSPPGSPYRLGHPTGPPPGLLSVLEEEPPNWSPLEPDLGPKRLEHKPEAEFYSVAPDHPLCPDTEAGLWRFLRISSEELGGWCWAGGAVGGDRGEQVEIKIQAEPPAWRFGLQGRRYRRSDRCRLYK